MKFIQYTNSAIGAVSASTALPLGIVTQKCITDGGQAATFTASTSGANLVNINEVGKYRVSYTGSLVPAGAGTATITLYVNNVATYTVATTAVASEEFELTFDYIIRVCNNCNSITTNFPATIQLMLGSVAITAGTSNLVIEKIG